MTARSLRTEVLGTLLPGFEGTALPAWVADRLHDGLAGVCLFGTNIHSPAQLRALTAAIAAANPVALRAVDEEGGDVTRLFYDSGAPYAGNAILGRLDDVSATFDTAQAVGSALREAGINLDFAPDADVNSNPDNPVIGVRSFGATVETVSRHTRAWVEGLQSTGVAASAKHFPGHGNTSADSHLALPVIDDSLAELRSRELLPFRAAIEAGARTIMTSHILVRRVDPDRPATLSAAVLQGLLRKELGFEGVIVSDALDMAGASGTIGIPEAAVQALIAGCDLLCLGSGTTDALLTDIENAVLAAVADGRLTEARVVEAAARVGELGRSVAGAGAGADTDADAASAAAVEEAGALSEGRVADSSVRASRVMSAFEVSDSGREWLARPGVDGVVALETEVSVAIGEVPWGLFGDGSDDSLDWDTEQSGTARRQLPRMVTRVSAPREVIGAIDDASRAPHQGVVAAADAWPPGSRVVVLGRGIHLHLWATRFVDRLRERCDVLVVELGWPSVDRRYADVCTFGASRLVGDALRLLLSAAPELQMTDRAAS